MKQKILNSIILFLHVSSYSYSQEFNYSKLRNKPINFIDKLLISNGENPYYVIPPFGTAYTSHKSNLVDVKIKDVPPIIHVCNDSIQDNQSNNNNNNNNNNEYLIYLNKKINLDSVFNNAVNGSTKYQTYVRFENYYSFTFNDRNFVVFRVTERRFFRNVLYFHLILLEIKKEKILAIFSFIDCPEETLKCFGDFNFDGNLDFIDWKKKNTRISMYSLYNNKFEKDKHYIIVKPTKSEGIYQKTYDNLFNYSLIDTKKSKWFYKL